MLLFPLNEHDWKIPAAHTLIVRTLSHSLEYNESRDDHEHIGSPVLYKLREPLIVGCSCLNQLAGALQSLKAPLLEQKLLA